MIWEKWYAETLIKLVLHWYLIKIEYVVVFLKTVTIYTYMVGLIRVRRFYTIRHNHCARAYTELCIIRVWKWTHLYNGNNFSTECLDSLRGADSIKVKT